MRALFFLPFLLVTFNGLSQNQIVYNDTIISISDEVAVVDITHVPKKAGYIYYKRDIGEKKPNKSTAHTSKTKYISVYDDKGNLINRRSFTDKGSVDLMISNDGDNVKKAGSFLIKSRKVYNVGIALNVLGGAIAFTSNGNNGQLLVGGVISGIGVVLNIISHQYIGKAGEELMK